MEREHTCAFTGHRPEKLPWGGDECAPGCVMLKTRIRAAVEQAYADGYRHFICGMAHGADLYFCEAVLALRGRYDGVTVEAAVPCAGQSARWRQEERRRYEALLAQCDFETLVQHDYDRACMRRRNRYMVDRAARLIAVFDGTAGGTMYTVAYAMKQGLEIVIVPVEEE